MGRRILVLLGIVAGFGLLFLLYKNYLSPEAQAKRAEEEAERKKLEASKRVQAQQFANDDAAIERFEKNELAHLDGHLITTLSKAGISAAIIRIMQAVQSNKIQEAINMPLTGFFFVEGNVLRPVTSVGFMLTPKSKEALMNAASRSQDFILKSKQGAGITLREAGIY